MSLVDRGSPTRTATDPKRIMEYLNHQDVDEEIEYPGIRSTS